MGIYERYVLPRLLDAGMSQKMWTPYRDRLLAPAQGAILEIGFGTGANLPHYPDTVRKITVVEPSSVLSARARRRLAASPIEIETHSVAAERLPFQNDAFDTVVSALTLCSVEDVRTVLAEILRVLKPGGRYLFLEHGLADEPGVARWQHRLNGLNARVAGGCQLIRDISDMVRGAGFAEVTIREAYVRDVPKVVGLVSEGSAVKGLQKPRSC